VVRKSTLKLYAPFIALALAQAAFVVVAPSKGEDNQNPFGQLSAGGASGGFAAGGGTIDPDTGQVIDGTAGGLSGSGGSTGGSGGSSGSGGVTGSGQTGAGDTRHCRGGRQTDVIFNAPPCAAKFTGDNGGATYPGVTDKEVKLIRFECQPNEQVNAILATQGLAASVEETNAMVEATTKFMNKSYEFYGRKLVWEHVIGDCPLTPPDPAKSRQAAAEIAKKKPMFVIHYAAGPETHDVWAQNGIVSIGGPNLDVSIYAGRRPFRWDIFPSGTEGAETVSEYYCKKLAGKAATNAGALIHPTIGNRTTKRHLGIIVPDNGNNASVPNARKVQQRVKECAGEDVPMFTYASDINRAEEQSRVTVAGLIDAKVTTVVCMCDAIAPVFMTTQMTRNNYFPEHQLPAANLLDYDVLGRLYDPAQWTHAFGPSQLTQPVPFEQTDAAKIWRAAGNTGNPCASCNLITGYMINIGSMIQMAGPNLNPLTIERALVGANYQRGGWAESKGNPTVYLIRYGPGDYNAISDYREVYWDATARSEIDGKNGAYVSIDGGRRYANGELGRDFKVQAKPQ
jgi:hypothetical protein